MMPILSRRYLSTVAATALTLTIAPAVRAENLSHVQQLLSTKQCGNCDLTGAGLVLAKLPGANLAGANLAGANLSQANLTGANLAGANLVGVSLAGTNLIGANLKGANLVGADLRGAYLSGADLSEVRLDRADFRNAIDLPIMIGSAEEFYGWAMEAGKQKRFEVAIDYFNQAIARKPNYASAILGRGMARWQLGDAKASLQDIDQAASLFETQGDKQNAEATKKVAIELRKPEKAEKGGGSGLGTTMLGLAGTLLRLFIGL